MHKKSKDKNFIVKPTYVGGLKAMREFIAKEMVYPKAALDQKIEGTVFLRYEVDYKGYVVSSKVLSHLGFGCDEEAQRIVSKMKFHVGKNPRKLKIKFNKSIKIKFKLPKEKAVAPISNPTNSQKHVNTISYTITKSKKPQTPKKEISYSYVIRY